MNETLKTKLQDASTWKAAIYLVVAGAVQMFPAYTKDLITGAFVLSGVISLFLTPGSAPIIPVPTAQTLPKVP